MPPRSLLDARTAAYYTGRPVGTIWRWASEGRITSWDGKYDYDELTEGTLDEPMPAPQLPHNRERTRAA